MSNGETGVPQPEFQQSETSTPNVPCDHRDYDATLLHINEFARNYCQIKSNADSSSGIDDECKEILAEVARTAICKYPWELLKVILAAAIEEVIQARYRPSVDHRSFLTEGHTYEGLLKHTIEEILRLDGPPVTLQRICEVVIAPPYSRVKKLLPCIRRLIAVSGTHTDVILLPDDSKFLKSEEVLNVKQEITRLCLSKESNLRQDVAIKFLWEFDSADGSTSHDALRQQPRKWRRRGCMSLDSEGHLETCNGVLSSDDDADLTLYKTKRQRKTEEQEADETDSTENAAQADNLMRTFVEDVSAANVIFTSAQSK